MQRVCLCNANIDYVATGRKINSDLCKHLPLSITFMILKDKHPYNIVKNVNKKDLKYINPSSIFGFVVASCFSLELEERNVSSKDSGRDN